MKRRAQPQSLTHPGYTPREGNDDAAEKRKAEGLRGVVRQLENVDSGSKGEKLFYFVRVPTLQHVVFTEKSTFTNPAAEENAWAVRFERRSPPPRLSPAPSTFSFFLSGFSFVSLSLSLSLARFYSARAVLAFSSTAASSSTRASVRGNRSRETRFSTARDCRVAPRSFLPTDYATRLELSCSLNIPPPKPLIRRTKTRSRRLQKLVKVRRWSSLRPLFPVSSCRCCGATTQRADDVALFLKGFFPGRFFVEEQRVARDICDCFLKC